ncbi:hypothetical protein QN379_21545 [Glaciimonas sp. Gout2]|uniref:hypothetical protein n=1 Tax=unclassified Glaciimonas TaxID=2644401 RepID=UPI002AB46EB3|nr:MULTISPECIES: hypothetical protein [unclassified Glaciimonas]MDY7548253.1 hypothetical protein [Glaciimonas sp. CA11.2]MEB0010597.1 hypothetical protein [Glaciimonas sp. Cout2]MEB0084599.1 hypothetical protein [Glaciimonas sp. Gout2]
MLVASLAAEGVEVVSGAIVEGVEEGAGGGIAGAVAAGACIGVVGDESAAVELSAFLQPPNIVATIIAEINKGLVNIYAPWKDGLRNNVGLVIN